MTTSDLRGDSPPESQEQSEGLSSPISRRRLLALGAQGAAAVGGGALIAACGGGKTTATDAAKSGTPKRGGTITLGMITGGSSETVVPALAINNPDLVRVPQLFDPLFRVGEDVRLVPMLATEATPNSDATSWTLQLRDGVHWHDGKPFTADDVVWTVKSWASPRNADSATVTGVIDYSRVRKRGPLTVEIPLLIPVAQFPTLITYYNLYVIPAGATNSEIHARPIGTGPFKYVSFEPAVRSVFTANRDYWQHGKPYIDKLVVISSFTNETARLNALEAGTVNVNGSVPGVIANQLKGNPQIKLLNSVGGNIYQLFVRIDKPPFTDNRVRQALRLAADRPALVANGLDGYGAVANDLPGVFTEYYATKLPQRVQDIEKARSLLKAAGKEGLTFALPVADAAPGFTACATLYAEQAKAAGINVQITQVPAANYFSPSGGYLTRTAGLDSPAATPPSLTQQYRTSLRKGAPYNDTWWGYQPGGAAADALLAEAVGTLNPSRAEELWFEVQKLQYEQNGTLIYATANFLDAVASNVHGLRTTKAGYLNNWQLLDGWIN